jgi:hypothetical protein
MEKNYTQKSFLETKMLPKKKIVSFLLDYSKALKVVHTPHSCIEIIVN